MVSTAAFIIGMVILGLCVVVAALLLSGAINGAATALKESAPQSLQQPTLSFLTEYDAADYLGISLNELDYIRNNGLLDGAFIAVTSLEQTGEETYYDYEDGVEVAKTRPVMSNVTRFLFNRQLLDEKMMEAIKNGSHINPFRSKGQDKPQDKKQGGKKNKNNDNNEHNAPKKDAPKHPVVQIFADENDEDTAPAEEIKTKSEDEPKEDSKPKASKPAAAGPPKPMGPIGDDDEDGDEVIDIMARINSAKQNGGSGKNGSPNRNGNGGQNRNGNNSRNGNHGGNPNRNRNN